MRYLVNRKTKEHQRMPFDCLYAPSGWSVVQADSEGWIAHTGSECPLPDDVQCEVKNKAGVQWDGLSPVGGVLISRNFYWPAVSAYRPIIEPEKVQEPEPIPAPQYDPRSVSFNLLDRLKAAHKHAQTIPELEAELREVLAGMGYDLVARSPFVEAEAQDDDRDDFTGELPDMSDWRNWLEGDLVLDYSSPWPVVSITKIAKSEDNSSRPVQLASPCGDLYSPDIKDLRFYSRPTQQRHGAGE